MLKLKYALNWRIQLIKAKKDDLLYREPIRQYLGL